MKNYIKNLFIFIILISLNSESANAVFKTFRPDVYKITVHAMRLCESGSTTTNCVNPVTLKHSSGGVTMDLAGASAGQSAGSFGNISLAKPGVTYTHGEVVMSRVFVIQGTMETTATDTCYTKTSNGITSIGQANVGDNIPNPSTTASDLSEMSIPLQGNTFSGGSAYNTGGNSTTKADGSGTDQAAGFYDGDDLFMKYRWALDKPFTPEFGRLSNMTIAFDLSGGLEYNDGSGGDGSCNDSSLMPGPISITNTFK